MYRSMLLFLDGYWRLQEKLESILNNQMLQTSSEECTKKLRACPRPDHRLLRRFVSSSHNRRLDGLCAVAVKPHRASSCLTLPRMSSSQTPQILRVPRWVATQVLRFYSTFIVPGAPHDMKMMPLTVRERIAVALLDLGHSDRISEDAFDPAALLILEELYIGWASSYFDGSISVFHGQTGFKTNNASDSQMSPEKERNDFETLSGDTVIPANGFQYCLTDDLKSRRSVQRHTRNESATCSATFQAKRSLSGYLKDRRPSLPANYTSNHSTSTYHGTMKSKSLGRSNESPKASKNWSNCVSGLLSRVFHFKHHSVASEASSQQSSSASVSHSSLSTMSSMSNSSVVPIITTDAPELTYTRECMVRVLQDKALYHEFALFVGTRHCHENLVFYEAFLQLEERLTTYKEQQQSIATMGEGQTCPISLSRFIARGVNPLASPAASLLSLHLSNAEESSSPDSSSSTASPLASDAMLPSPLPSPSESVSSVTSACSPQMTSDCCECSDRKIPVILVPLCQLFYATHIAPGSPNEVNLTHDIRKEISKQFELNEDECINATSCNGSSITREHAMFGIVGTGRSSIPITVFERSIDHVLMLIYNNCFRDFVKSKRS